MGCHFAVGVTFSLSADKKHLYWFRQSHIRNDMFFLLAWCGFLLCIQWVQEDLISICACCWWCGTDYPEEVEDFDGSCELTQRGCGPARGCVSTASGCLDLRYAIFLLCECTLHICSVTICSPFCVCFFLKMEGSSYDLQLRVNLEHVTVFFVRPECTADGFLNISEQQGFDFICLM